MENQIQSFVYDTKSSSKITKKTFDILSLYNESNPLLYKKMPVVNLSAPPADLEELALSLISTMDKYAGAGLAANQCGVPCRMFVMSGGIVVINPTILEKSETTTRYKEGCLTYPGLILPITRPETIKVEFFDLTGNKKTETYTGVTARVFQHEYDHLEGKVFTSKVGSLTLQMARKKKQKIFKKIERIVEYKKRMGEK